VKQNLLDYEPNMHISDGILKPEWVYFSVFAISAIFIALGLSDIINKPHQRRSSLSSRIALLGRSGFCNNLSGISLVPVYWFIIPSVGTPMGFHNYRTFHNGRE